MKKLYNGCLIQRKHVAFLNHHNKVLCLDWLLHWQICITTGMTHIKMAVICHDTCTYLKDTFMLQFLLLMHVWTSNTNIYKTYLRSLGDYICSHKFLKMHTAIYKQLYSNSEMWKQEALLSCPRWLHCLY